MSGAPVTISIAGGPNDLAAWALAQRSGNRAASFTLQAGGRPPDWFWEAVADGRIEITGAKYGDLGWGQNGVDVHGLGGTFHVPLGGALAEDDQSAPPPIPPP